MKYELIVETVSVKGMVFKPGNLYEIIKECPLYPFPHTQEIIGKTFHPEMMVVYLGHIDNACSQYPSKIFLFDNKYFNDCTGTELSPELYFKEIL